MKPGLRGSLKMSYSWSLPIQISRGGYTYLYLFSGNFRSVVLKGKLPAFTFFFLVKEQFNFVRS